MSFSLVYNRLHRASGIKRRIVGDSSNYLLKNNKGLTKPNEQRNMAGIRTVTEYDARQRVSHGNAQ